MKTETIKIGDGRYIIIVSGDSQFFKDGRLNYITEALNLWWNSGDKFFILGHIDDVTIKVERVEDGQS